MKNPYCDNDKCKSETGEVRVLPLSTESLHGNLILCHNCFFHELAWRKERNRNLEKQNHFDLPKWEDLEIYKIEE